MITLGLHDLIISFSYVAIFFLMISNGIISFPSSQFLYLAVGYFVGTGSLAFIPAVIVGAVGNSIGNFILYFLVLLRGESFARKIIPLEESMYLGIKKAFSNKGVLWFGIAKLIPSLKVMVPVIAGLARTPPGIITPLFFISSTIWAAFFIYLGKVFGEHISLGSYSLIVGTIGIIVFVYLAHIVKKNSAASSPNDLD